MKKVYLVCTRSAITASALTYIINQSPDFYKQIHNNLWLEEHSKYFGTAHIINDWWNVSDRLKTVYNKDFRNNDEMEEQTLIDLCNVWDSIETNKHICLFTHARNTDDIIKYRDKNKLPIVVITTLMGERSYPYIPAFLKREYNDEMNDFEHWLSAWVYTYNQVIVQDTVWREHCDVAFEMDDWLNKTWTIYDTLDVTRCEDINLWVHQYLLSNNSIDEADYDTINYKTNEMNKFKQLMYMLTQHGKEFKMDQERAMYALMLYHMMQEQSINSTDEFVKEAKHRLGLS